MDTLKITTENGYIIEKWNANGYILTRKGAATSNYFYIRDGKPIFDDMVYVNNFTRTLIKKYIIDN